VSFATETGVIVENAVISQQNALLTEVEKMPNLAPWRGRKVLRGSIAELLAKSARFYSPRGVSGCR
jgi:hypothetical protein